MCYIFDLNSPPEKRARRFSRGRTETYDDGQNMLISPLVESIVHIAYAAYAAVSAVSPADLSCWARAVNRRSGHNLSGASVLPLLAYAYGGAACWSVCKSAISRRRPDVIDRTGGWAQKNTHTHAVQVVQAYITSYNRTECACIFRRAGGMRSDRMTREHTLSGPCACVCVCVWITRTHCTSAECVCAHV